MARVGERVRTELERLKHQDFFHRMFPRALLGALLRHDGDFLLRLLGPDEGTGGVVDVAVYHNATNQILHYHVFADGLEANPFCLNGGRYFKTLDSLVEYYWKQRASLPGLGAVAPRLLQAVPRSAWEISPRSLVELGPAVGHSGHLRKGRFMREASGQAPYAVAIRVCLFFVHPLFYSFHQVCIMDKLLVST